MNFCGIDGNLTRDVEIATTPNGKTFATFCIANNYYYGEEQKTDFYNVKAWGFTAEKVHKYAKKGTRVLVTGEMRNVLYEAKDGSRKQYFEIQAQKIDIIFNQPKSEENKTVKKANQIPMLEEVEDGDLPF